MLPVFLLALLPLPTSSDYISGDLFTATCSGIPVSRSIVLNGCTKQGAGTAQLSCTSATSADLLTFASPDCSGAPTPRAYPT